MTTMKTTKRALLSSVLALFLCFAMLLGTTYAWFTDSVSSLNNVITAGNLDVVLEYKTDLDDDWAPVDENTKVFKEGALYEPGYVETVFLRVANAGSLALKYKLKIDIVDEKGSTNVNGDAFKLSDYLQIGSYVQDEYSSGANYADILFPTMFGTRAAVLSNINNFAVLSKADTVIAKDAPVQVGEQTSQVFAVALAMPETVGNEANAKTGVAAPEITLGINLVATQLMDESDSFGTDYDNGAYYPDEIPSADAFELALENGGKYTLTADITNDAAESFVIPEGVEVAINLNGHKITNSVAGAPAIVNNGKLTISGSGDIVNDVSDTAKSHTIHNYGDLVINGGNIGTFATSGAAVVNDGTATINGGNFASRQESNTQYGQGPAAYCFINNGSGIMTINDATVNGPTHGLFAAYAGKLVINGGNYTLEGNNGMGCYVVYATGDGEVILVGGTVNTNEPRHNRVFYVSAGGNKFNADAVNTSNLTYIGTKIYLNGVEQIYTDNQVESVSNKEDFAAALDATGVDVITLADDVALADNATVIVGDDLTLVLNGNTLSATNDRTNTHNFMIDVKGGALTILNGTVTMKHTGANMAWNGAATTIDVTAGGVLNLSNVIVKNEGGTDMNFAVHMNNWGEVTLNADNCVFDAPYCGVRVFNSGYDMNNVTITNSTLKGNTRAFWVHNYIGDLNSAQHSDDAIKARLNFDIFNGTNTFEITGTAKSPVRYGFGNTVYLDVDGNVIP